MQNYTVRARRGGSASSTPNSPRNRPRRPPEGPWVARTAGVERESDVVEFDDQGSTRMRRVRYSAVDGAQGKDASRVRVGPRAVGVLRRDLDHVRGARGQARDGRGRRRQLRSDRPVCRRAA